MDEPLFCWDICSKRAEAIKLPASSPRLVEVLDASGYPDYIDLGPARCLTLDSIKERVKARERSYLAHQMLAVANGAEYESDGDPHIDMLVTKILELREEVKRLSVESNAAHALLDDVHDLLENTAASKKEE